MPGVTWPALPGPRGVMRLALLHQLAATQWWSAEQLAQMQLRQLGELVAHARKHSPHYARTLAHLPRELDEQSWLSIPILSRDAVQTQKASLRSQSCPQAHGGRQTIFSSGSTGKPVAVEQTSLTQLFWEAFTLRDHEWHRRDLGGKLCSIRFFPDGCAAPPLGGRGPNWGGATADLVRTGPVAMLDVRSTVEQQLEWLQKEQPDYLLTHPTILESLLRALEDGAQLRLDHLREVRTVSETLQEGLRERCREALGVPLTDIYSTRETGYLGLQCPEHEHYHLQAENARVEILDEAGQSCGPGSIGRVVVTPLHNFAFPLLRYEVGDYAEVGGPCPCGRGLAVVRRILGRQRNMLRLPNGQSHWPILNYKAMNAIVPLRQLRMTQLDLAHIEIDIVTARRPDEGTEKRLGEEIRRNLGYPFQLVFRYVDEIPRSAGGKFEDFVSRVA
ncbi:MAG: AMP-binding protein [Azoarcus sp.]|nr:AMP-binding protein [Azoarcus sp.]